MQVIDIGCGSRRGVINSAPRNSHGILLSGLLALAAIVACGGAGNSGAPTPTPTPSHSLRLAAQTHNLLMGTAADSGYLSETLYASTLSTEYSLLEAENEMKFGPIHPEPNTYNYKGPDELVSFAQSHSMKVRGHNLVWHSQVPNWVTNPSVPWTTAALNQVLSDHIANVVGHYKGQIYAWDVVNEPFNDDGTIRSTIWYDSPGIGFAGEGTRTIEQALVWAHAADPAAKLFVNEYGAETMNAKSGAVYAMAQDFVTRGVPLAGIGLELHIDPSFDSTGTLASLSQNIQRLGALGLEVHFTEVDVRLPDSSAASLTMQAKTYQDLLTVCLAQPSCKAFQTWGFTDKYSWIPSFFTGFGWALPFDQNYAKKPAYTSLLQKMQ
jgi:endo-1,4-beta-xylanase